MIYDTKQPDEYHSYWEKEENLKNSILYGFTDEYERELKGEVSPLKPTFDK